MIRWGEQGFWTPSLHYFKQTVDLLVLTNLDEDHITDFDGMIKDCIVPWILSNPTIGPWEFALLKKDGMGAGSNAVARWLDRPKGTSLGTTPDFGSMQIRWYYCIFVADAVNNTNDLRQRNSASAPSQELGLGALAGLGFGRNPFSTDLGTLLSRSSMSPPSPKRGLGILGIAEQQ